MLPFETYLITKRDTKPQCRLSPRIQAQQPPSQVSSGLHIVYCTPSCISRNVQNNITIKQMLILNPKIPRIIPNTLSKAPQRWPAASQHFPTCHFFTLPSPPASITGVFSPKNTARLLPFTTGSDDTFSHHPFRVYIPTSSCHLPSPARTNTENSQGTDTTCITQNSKMNTFSLNK